MVGQPAMEHGRSGIDARASFSLVIENTLASVSKPGLDATTRRRTAVLRPATAEDAVGVGLAADVGIDGAAAVAARHLDAEPHREPQLQDGIEVIFKERGYQSLRSSSRLGPVSP